MLLEQLVEKKDLMAYTEFRIKTLVRNIKNVPENEPPENRQRVIEKLEAKIAELKRLRHIIAEGTLKEESKKHYKSSEAWKDE